MKDFRSATYVAGIINKLIDLTPGNIRALSIMNKEVGVGGLHRSTLEGYDLTQNLFQTRLARLQDLQGPLQERIRPAPESSWETPIIREVLFRNKSNSDFAEPGVLRLDAQIVNVPGAAPAFHVRA